MAYILIVDDDEMVAEMASEILMDAGHACGWVVDGPAALRLLEWRRPDLLLLDQDMPGLTGAKVLRTIRTSPRLYDLPVIMFTAITGAEDEQQALYSGAQDYIRKPFDAKFLTWKVDHVLRTRADRPKHLDLKDMLTRQASLREENLTSARRVL